MLVGSLVFEPPTPQRRGFLKAHQLWTETDTLWENGDVEEIASEQWQERSWFCLDYRRHTINVNFSRDYTNPISANLYETTAREWDNDFFWCSIGSWLYFFAILLTGCWGSQVSPYMIILIRTPWPWRFPSQFVDTQVSHICLGNGSPQQFCSFYPLWTATLTF